MPEPMVLVDVALRTPPDRDFWTDETMYDAERRWPSWTTSQVAMTFFAVSKHTIARHLREGNNVSEFTGTVLPPRRETGKELYIWRLCDIERMAFAMAANGVLTNRKLSRAVLMVKTCAEQYDFL
jgi:hypothetical protein